MPDDNRLHEAVRITGSRLRQCTSLSNAHASLSNARANLRVRFDHTLQLVGGYTLKHHWGHTGTRAAYEGVLHGCGMGGG
jgi:hypothetical protein